MSVKFAKSDFLVWVEELQAGKWDKNLRPVRKTLVKKPIQDAEDNCKSDSTYSASK